MHHYRLAGIVQMLVIVELTVATASIHLSLGGQIFTLNGLGYLGLAAAYVATATLGSLQRFNWLSQIGLAGYAALTIAAYLIIGPYFELGWITKAIELAIIRFMNSSGTAVNRVGAGFAAHESKMPST